MASHTPLFSRLSLKRISPKPSPVLQECMPLYSIKLQFPIKGKLKDASYVSATKPTLLVMPETMYVYIGIPEKLQTSNQVQIQQCCLLQFIKVLNSLYSRNKSQISPLMSSACTTSHGLFSKLGHLQIVEAHDSISQVREHSVCIMLRKVGKLNGCCAGYPILQIQFFEHLHKVWSCTTFQLDVNFTRLDRIIIFCLYQIVHHQISSGTHQLSRVNS